MCISKSESWLDPKNIYLQKNLVHEANMENPCAGTYRLLLTIVSTNPDRAITENRKPTKVIYKENTRNEEHKLLGKIEMPKIKLTTKKI